MQLIVDDIWKPLRQSWKKGPRLCAVAYYSCDYDLGYGLGDVLVVNASDRAITSGQTSVEALRRAHLAGAHVYSHGDLHAKVYVLGGVAYVGSANASVNAREVLIEALAMTDDPISVGAAANFVLAVGQAAIVVDDEFLARIGRLPVEPRVHRRRTGVRPVYQSPRCWLIGLAETEYPGDFAAAERKSKTIKRRTSESDEVDWFFLDPGRSRLFREARAGDTFIEIDHDNATSTRTIKVWPPTRIHDVTDDVEGRRLFHFAIPAQDPPHLSWRQFLKLIGEVGWTSEPSVKGSRLVPQKYAEAISRRWPTQAP